MKILPILIAAGLLLGGCAMSATPAPSPTEMLRETPVPTNVAVTVAAPLQTAVSTPVTPVVQTTLVYTVTGAAGYVDTYFVDPGLDDPTPPLDGQVILRAKLNKNGLRLWFAPTHVTWMQGGELQTCDFLPLYLAGCVIEVRDFTPGAYVPVTLTMQYNGMVFMGYTGFTPE